MIKDITIGQYLYKKSFVHELDSRTKIICSTIFMIIIFSINSIQEYFLLFFIILISTYLSKIHIKKLFKGLKPMLPLLVLTPIMNLFFIKGGKILFEYNSIQINENGLNESIFMLLRLIFLIFFTSLLTLTTSPIDLTNGIESILNIFKFFRIPSHEIALMMSIALRFIPTLIDETCKIMNAQKSRGANFETGSIIKRSKALTSILTPLFISAFNRADDLATSMEARGYKGEGERTKFKQLKFKKKDYIVLFIFNLFLIIIFIRKIII